MILLRSLILPLLAILGFTVTASAAELAVFAASSLTEALHEVAQAYQAQHPEDRLNLNFAGSQTLAAQIEQGASADLFIAADTTVMERLRGRDLVEKPEILLQNQLTLVVRADLQANKMTLADLARPGLLLAIGNRQVPVGRYTRQLFARLSSDPAYGPVLVEKLERNIVSEENQVKAIVAKLILGEVDAGIVYRSDLTASNSQRLIAVPLPQQDNPKALYPLAKVRGSQPRIEAFKAFLFSPAAQQIFIRHGFLPGGEQ